MKKLISKLDLLQRGKHKEYKISAIIFFFTILFIYILLLLEIEPYKSLNFFIALEISLSCSVITLLISKYHGALKFWVYCVNLKKRFFYKLMLFFASVSFFIFIFSEGGKIEEISEYIDFIVNSLFGNDSIYKFLYDSKFYIIYLGAVSLAELIFYMFCPVSLKWSYNDFSNKNFHSLALKKEVEKVLQYLNKKEDYLLDKDKENISSDLITLGSYESKKPSQVYDVLIRHSYIVRPWIGYVCLMLISIIFTIPIYNISNSILNYL